MDTRDKRSSAVNVGSPWRGQLPAPDSSVDQPDQQHVAFYYAGIAAQGSGGASIIPLIMASYRRRWGS